MTQTYVLTGQQAADAVSEAIQTRPSAEISLRENPSFFSVRLMASTPEGILIFPVDMDKARERLDVGKPVILRYLWKGAFYQFDTSVVGFSDRERFEFFIGGPESLERVQRRESFRVGPSDETPMIVAAFEERRDAELKAIVVRNVSMTGIALRMPTMPDYFPGDDVGHFKVEFGPDAIDLSGVVRRVQVLADKHFEIAIQFHPLPPAAYKVLQDYILACQREALRKRH